MGQTHSSLMEVKPVFDSSLETKEQNLSRPYEGRLGSFAR
jgi:hypothetical protein